MWLKNNPYGLAGLILALAGALTGPVFYFVVESVPLTAGSLSAIILGCTFLALANARPYLSPQASRMLLRTGMENTAALLEELGINQKAIYLPGRLRDGHAQALVSLSGKESLPEMREKLAGRLIVRYGPDPADMALAITTAGTVNLEILPNKPGADADEIESALNYILSGVLDIARGARATLSDNRIEVRIEEARLEEENVWYYRCLGSPIASIAAAVCSEALDKPVRITEERLQKNQLIVDLEVLK